jgi:hypothetical protein
MRGGMKGYMVVIDAEGAEVASSRRDVSGMPLEHAVAVRRDLEAVMGPDCHVEFVPQD